MDNFFKLPCPPKMEDQGRQLTDYNSGTRRNEYIKYINDIYRDDQYRLFLQRHGKEFMDREFEHDLKNYSCRKNACIHNGPTRTNARIMVDEKLAFNSIFNPALNEKYAPLRRCTTMRNYRMNSDS